MPNRPCPRCTFPLVAQSKTTPVGSCVIDVCPRCNGAFFEAGEAKAILGENAEPATWERTSAARFIAQRRGMLCPLGHGALSGFALQAPPNSGTEVEVDVCPVCLGMWLDAWEAARVVSATQHLRAADVGTAARDDEVAAQVAAGIPQKTGAGWYLFQLFTALPVEEYNP